MMNTFMTAQPDGCLMGEIHNSHVNENVFIKCPAKVVKSPGLKEKQPSWGHWRGIIVIWVSPEIRLGENTEHSESCERLCYVSKTPLFGMNWKHDLLYVVTERAPVKPIWWSPGRGYWGTRDTTHYYLNQICQFTDIIILILLLWGLLEPLAWA